MIVTIFQAELDSMGDKVPIGQPSAQSERRDIVQGCRRSCKNCGAEKTPR